MVVGKQLVKGWNPFKRSHRRQKIEDRESALASYESCSHSQSADCNGDTFSVSSLQHNDGENDKEKGHRFLGRKDRIAESPPSPTTTMTQRDAHTSTDAPWDLQIPFNPPTLSFDSPYASALEVELEGNFYLATVFHRSTNDTGHLQELAIDTRVFGKEQINTDMEDFGSADFNPDFSITRSSALSCSTGSTSAMAINECDTKSTEGSLPGKENDFQDALSDFKSPLNLETRIGFFNEGEDQEAKVEDADMDSLSPKMDLRNLNERTEAETNQVSVKQSERNLILAKRRKERPFRSRLKNVLASKALSNLSQNIAVTPPAIGSIKTEKMQTPVNQKELDMTPKSTTTPRSKKLWSSNKGASRENDGEDEDVNETKSYVWSPQNRSSGTNKNVTDDGSVSSTVEATDGTSTVSTDHRGTETVASKATLMTSMRSHLAPSTTRPHHEGARALSIVPPISEASAMSQHPLDAFPIDDDTMCTRQTEEYGNGSFTATPTATSDGIDEVADQQATTTAEPLSDREASVPVAPSTSGQATSVSEAIQFKLLLPPPPPPPLPPPPRRTTPPKHVLLKSARKERRSSKESAEEKTTSEQIEEEAVIRTKQEEALFEAKEAYDEHETKDEVAACETKREDVGEEKDTVTDMKKQQAIFETKGQEAVPETEGKETVDETKEQGVASTTIGQKDVADVVDEDNVGRPEDILDSTLLEIFPAVTASHSTCENGSLEISRLKSLLEAEEQDTSRMEPDCDITNGTAKLHTAKPTQSVECKDQGIEPQTVEEKAHNASENALSQSQNGLNGVSSERSSSKQRNPIALGRMRLLSRKKKKCFPLPRHPSPSADAVDVDENEEGETPLVDWFDSHNSSNSTEEGSKRSEWTASFAVDESGQVELDKMQASSCDSASSPRVQVAVSESSNLIYWSDTNDELEVIAIGSNQNAVAARESAAKGIRQRSDPKEDGAPPLPSKPTPEKLQTIANVLKEANSELLRLGKSCSQQSQETFSAVSLAIANKQATRSSVTPLTTRAATRRHHAPRTQQILDMLGQPGAEEGSDQIGHTISTGMFTSGAEEGSDQIGHTISTGMFTSAACSTLSDSSDGSGSCSSCSVSDEESCASDSAILMSTTESGSEEPNAFISIMSLLPKSENSDSDEDVFNSIDDDDDRGDIERHDSYENVVNQRTNLLHFTPCNPKVKRPVKARSSRKANKTRSRSDSLVDVSISTSSSADDSTDSRLDIENLKAQVRMAQAWFQKMGTAFMGNGEDDESTVATAKANTVACEYAGVLGRLKIDINKNK
jgi:hypothetical protein